MRRATKSLSQRIRKFIALLAVGFLVGTTTTYIASVASATAHVSDTAVTLSSNSHYLRTNGAGILPTEGSFTLQTWFKRKSTSGSYSMLFSQGTSGNLFYLQVLSGGGMHWQYGSFGSGFGWTVPNDHWTHVSFTYSESADKKSNFVRIYINGILSYTWSAGSNFLANRTSATSFNSSAIGAYTADYITTSYRWHGQVDETRVYNKALSQSEVLSSMHNYGNPLNSNLIAHYDFNGASLANKAKGEAKRDNATLVLTGAPSIAWEEIAVTKYVSTENKNYVSFPRSYLTESGGWPVPAGAAKINYAVIGGGGGGGARHAGGGGAGAAQDAVGVPVQLGSEIRVQVGAAGISGINAGDGGNGGESVISSNTFRTASPGGGGGGGGGRAGKTGASGGGGGAAWGSGTDGTAGFGNKGGNARFFLYSNGGENWHGGGGGGAATAGTSAAGNGDSMRSGSGGNGKSFSWFTSAGRTAIAETVGVGQVSSGLVYFAGGGAGGKWGFGLAGNGGLGGGGNAFATPGLPHSGSGGGAGAGGTGGYGGGGVVIISYGTTPNVPQNFVARPITDTQVDLTWDDPIENGASVAEYEIVRSLDSSFSNPVTQVISRDTQRVNQKFSITSLVGATNYFFKVAAKNPTSTGAFTGAKDAKTWVKIGEGDCIDYVSSATGVTTTLNTKRDSCVVSFTNPSISTEWAVPVGATKIDTLVVGGGGGGGSAAGSGGSGGSVVDLQADLGASAITRLLVSVGTGGTGGSATAATAGGDSVLRGTDGVNSFAITSTGGRAGASGTTARSTAVAPTASSLGGQISLLERIKAIGGLGGLGTSSSSAGANGSDGYSPATANVGSVFEGSYAGGGGGGPVVASLQGNGVVLLFGDDVAALNLPFALTSTPTLAQFSTPLQSPNNLMVFPLAGGGSQIALYFSHPITDKRLTFSGSSGTPLISGGYTAPSFANYPAGTYDILNAGPPLVSTYQSATAGNGLSGAGSSAAHSASATEGEVGVVSPPQAGAIGTGGGGGAGLKGLAGSENGAAGGSGLVRLQYPLLSPPIVLTSPEDVTVASGEPVSFTASFASEVSSIRWQQSINAGITWTEISGSETMKVSASIYTIPATASLDNGKRFRAVGRNSSPTGAAFIDTPTLSAFMTVTKDAETLPTGAFCDGTSTQNGLTTEAGHGKVLYIDTGQGQEIDAGYVAYTIKTQTARGDLWVELSDFTGGVISLADPSTASMPLGEISGTKDGAAFFLLKAKSATTTAQAHVLRIYNQKPSIGNPAPIYQCSFAFSRVEETIKAAANKVDSVTSTSVTSIGSTLTITVKGDSGTIGSGNDIDGRMFWLIPAARSSWPVNAVRLEKTNLSLYADAANRDAKTNVLKSFDNTLRVNASNGLPTNSRVAWTATYTYRIIGASSAKVPIIPIAMISSGTQIKHTDVGSILSLPLNQPPTGGLNLFDPAPIIDLVVTKDAARNVQVRDDGTTRFEYFITLRNNGVNDLVVDEIIDTPDSKAAYVPGTSSVDDLPISDPGKVGTTNSIAFSGPITVPANSAKEIKYAVAIETCKSGGSFSMQNTATARSGSIVIGSGSSTQSVVSINGNCGESEIDVFVEDVVMEPDVTTSPAENVSQTTARITGVVDPNGISQHGVRFQYSTSATLGSATSVALSSTSTSDTGYRVFHDLSGLSANTTYFYRLEVETAPGVWKLGQILSFTTAPVPVTPLAATLAVTDISTESVTRVTFNGTIDPNHYLGGAKVKFEYAKLTSGSCESGTLTEQALTGFMQSESSTVGSFEDSVFDGSGATPVSFVQSGLTANTDYCVRLIGYYGADPSEAVGSWVAFKTAEKTPQLIIWKTGTEPLPAKGTTTVQAFAESTLPVTYTSADPTICTVHPTTGVVTAVANSGNCVITATQAGNDQYYAAEPQTINFLISAPVITTTSLPEGTYFSSYSQTLQATGGTTPYGSWALATGFTSELPRGLTISGSGVISGIPEIAGIYVIYVTVTDAKGVKSDPQPLTITIGKIPIDVRASSHDLKYGDGAPRITPSYDETKLVGGDTSAELLAAPNVAPVCSTNYTRGLPAGDLSSLNTCAGGWAENYTFSYFSGTITIAPLAITIRAVDTAKKAGSVDPALSFTVSPALPAGQTLSNVIEGGVPTLSVVRPDGTASSGAGETTGSYPIDVTATLVRLPYTETDPDTGNTFTAERSNYSLTVVSATLTVTDRITPVIETSSQVITFGDDLTGKLNALAQDDTEAAPITVAGTYRYSYLDDSGNEVTINALSKLDAGSYKILVTFTPADGAKYQGPIRSSFPLTVKPFEIWLRALDGAKENKEFSAELEVKPDPQLNYLISPKLPAGQTIQDVFSNGVKVTRERGGTAAGKYPKVNTAIGAKEGLNTVHEVIPGGEFSPNYSVTVIRAAFTITGLRVPDLSAQDASKIVNQQLGERLSATAMFEGQPVPGTYQYSYFDADGTEVIVTPATALDLGLHSIMVKFTPDEIEGQTPFFGPVLTSMFVTVNPFVASGGGSSPGGNQNIVEPPGINPKPKPGPGSGGGGTSPGGTQGGGSGGGGTATGGLQPNPGTGLNPGGSLSDPSRNGPYAVAAPSIPGFGSLIPRIPGANVSGGEGTSIDQDAWTRMLQLMTVDLGNGIQSATPELVAGAYSSLGQAKRTLGELATERVGGFSPPGSGVRIEVLGARTGARFVIADLSAIDSQALLVALTNSIQSQKTDFFQIQNVMIDAAPAAPQPWTPQEQSEINEFFQGAGLEKPISLADVDFEKINNWVGIEAWATSYVPGSVVYLTVTSSPLVIASAVADSEGRVLIDGVMPVEYLGAGEHRIRLVGTRSLDGVFVDERGEIQVTDATMAEIELFDLQTQATIAFIGSNEAGGTHVAMRVIPLFASAPWWVVIVLSLLGLLIIALRRRSRLFSENRKLLAPLAIAAAAVPAVIIGWLSTVTEVVWVSLAVGVVLAALSLVISPKFSSKR